MPKTAEVPQAQMPSDPVKLAGLKQDLQTRAQAIADQGDDEETLKEIKAGVESNILTLKADLSAADWSEKIGRRIKQVAPVEVDILRVERGDTRDAAQEGKVLERGAYYNVSFRTKAGKEGFLSIQSKQFVSMGEKERARWLRRLVNAALKQPLNS